MKTTKKLSWGLRTGILLLCMATVFAVVGCGNSATLDNSATEKNNSTYTINLNNMAVENNEKTATFDKTTGKVTIKKRDAYIGCWLDNKDVSDYNIIRIKYNAPDDVGFNFTIDYPNDSLNWYDTTVYCPSYLTEMVFPILPSETIIKAIGMSGAWNTEYEEFYIKEITLEKVDNPVKTNVHISNASPVIDAATEPAAEKAVDADFDAWDFVPQLGVGFNYFPFISGSNTLDLGSDFYASGFSKSNTRNIFKMLKQKGFETIRLPVNPGNQFVDDEYNMDSRFVEEIKYVVDIAIEEGMYVILCGYFWPPEQYGWEINKTKDYIRFEGVIVNEQEKDRSEKLLKAFWTQISRAFNNSYDEHLIFETMNEPLDLIHTEHSGNPEDQANCPVCQNDFKIGNEYNQLIVDTIRASGGNNANRFIMVAAFGYPYRATFKLPDDDTAANKLIPIMHMYPMGVENYEKLIYSQGIKKAEITHPFELMDEWFFSKNIPVYVSEVNAPRLVPVPEKINMMKDFMAEVKKQGRSCNVTLHVCPDLGENDFCYLNMYTCEWKEEEFFDAILAFAKGQEVKEYQLSKVESIVGKELLTKSYDLEDWDSYEINSSIFARATPEKYKIEIVWEAAGEEPKFSLNYIDADHNWRWVIPENKTIQGGLLDLYDNDKKQTIYPEDSKIVVGITDDDVVNIEYSGLYICGSNIILKSVKVVE